MDRKEPHISTLAKRIKVFTFRSHSLRYLQEARYPDAFSVSQEGIQMRTFARVPCNWKDSCQPTSVAENACVHFPQARLEPEAWLLLQAGWGGKARGGGGVGATPPVAAAQQCWQEEAALPSASALTIAPIHCHRTVSARLYLRRLQASQITFFPRPQWAETRALLTVLETPEWTPLSL